MTFKKIMKNKAMIAMRIFIVAFIASLPFISRAVSGTEMQTNELTDTSVLITGRILNPDNQSVKIGTVEQNNPQASYVYTNPFTLLDDASVPPIEGRTGNTTGYGNTSVGERTGKNNTTGYGNTSVGEKGVYNNTSAYGNTGVGEKGSAYNSVVYQTISGLAPNTTYCSVVVDASDPSNTPIYGSEICYTTLATGASYKNGELTSVVLDTQSMTDTSATIKFMVNPDGKALGLSLKYGVGKKDFTDSDYTKDIGEFFRTATTTSNSLPATAEIKNLEKDTTYYYEVYNTDTKEVYHDNLFTTAASAGTVINQNSSNTTTTTTCVPGEYCLLAPLPGLSKINVQTTGIGGYLAIIFKIGIGLAGVLAVVMLVVGGIQYMSTDAFSEKADGKSRMMNAIIGLLLVLGAWVILNTLNPNLLIFNLDLQKVSITVDPSLIDSDEAETQPPTGANYTSYPYKNGDKIDDVFPTPKTSDMLGTLKTLNVDVSGSNSSKPICDTVGQTGCTALAGIPSKVTVGLQKIRTKCPNCELTITGGTEFWLHKSHGPGKDKIDLRNNSRASNFVKYVTSGKKIGQITGWGVLYVTDGIEFVDEGNHYHVWGWNNDHASSYNK